MTENKMLRGLVVLLAIVCLTLGLLMSKREGDRELKDRLDALESDNRELNDKAFELESALGRYQVTLDYLKSINPSAANLFEDYMYNETE